MRPNSMNLDGIFKVLPNVGWTSFGPVAPGELSAVRERAMAAGVHLEVRSVDKFPAMLDYVVQVTDDATRVTREDLDGLRGHGFDDKAILQITLIASWFNYINRVADALGVGRDDATGAELPLPPHAAWAK